MKTERTWPRSKRVVLMTGVVAACAVSSFGAMLLLLTRTELVASEAGIARIPDAADLLSVVEPVPVDSSQYLSHNSNPEPESAAPLNWADTATLVRTGHRHFKADDRLSHIHMKRFADHHFGSLPVPPQFEPEIRAKSISAATPDIETRVRDGDVVYVDAFFYRDFERDVMPRIRNRFILITGDSSICTPLCIMHSQEKAVKETDVVYVAMDTRVIHWYATHCSSWTMAAQKITCLPLGLDQHSTSLQDMQRAYENGLGLVDGLVQRRKIWVEQPSQYLLVSFQISTNPEMREPLWDWLCEDLAMTDPQYLIPSLPALRRVSNCFYQRGMDRYEFYMDVMAASTFIISPQGYGLDCYRTYEAILLGAYPIVVTSELDILFKDLPVLIVKSWVDLTVELMEATFADFQRRKFDFSTLYMDYWKARMRAQAGRDV